MRLLRPRFGRRGFTLIELAMVVLIIGLVIAFILVTGFAGVEQARVRATQALITKIEVGLNDRLDALLAVQIKANGAHKYLASVPFTGVYTPWGLTSEARAEAIARVDQIKRELPDVFYIQTTSPGANDYPINFAGLPYPIPSGGFNTPQVPYAYVLPLGNRAGPGFTPSPNDPNAMTGYTAADLDPDGDGNPNIGPGAFVGVSTGSYGDPTAVSQSAYGGVADEGIYGASYTARAALHKLIGATAWGTDSADNNGNGLIDEYGECISNADGSSNATAIAAFNTFFTNHAHKTARSEMLYALLVEGTGPLGNVFSAGDFRDTEVKDTDGDGLPEFVDGWGEPIQFYRWPIYHPAADLQLGSAPYQYVSQSRETFPLDPGKQLVSPAWFGDNAGASSSISAKAQIFHNYFIGNVDPNWPSTAGPPYANLWDITGVYPRRAFSCKFLVMSGGPDRLFGVGMMDDSSIASLRSGGNADSIAVQIIGNPGDPSSGGNSPILGEGWAAFTNGYPSAAALANGIDAPPSEALDNITNLDLQSASGGIR